MNFLEKLKDFEGRMADDGASGEAKKILHGIITGLSADEHEAKINALRAEARLNVAKSRVVELEATEMEDAQYKEARSRKLFVERLIKELESEQERLHPKVKSLTMQVTRLEDRKAHLEKQIAIMEKKRADWTPVKKPPQLATIGEMVEAKKAEHEEQIVTA